MPNLQRTGEQENKRWCRTETMVLKDKRKEAIGEKMVREWKEGEEIEPQTKTKPFPDSFGDLKIPRRKRTA
jgi:hypothetical protein